MDLELLDSIHALEGSKTLQRDLGRPCHKLQELGPVRLVKGAQRPPEPLDLRWGGGKRGEVTA